MASQVENRESINEDEAALELTRLRDAAKRTAIYYSNGGKFQKRTDLSHIVHASLHCVQFVITSSIEIFHHVHHYLNERAREKDDTIPSLPEERNPIFFLYPICMGVSLLLAILWFRKKILPDRPLIPLIVCATAAILMLLAGIMEMKHADIYIDVTEFTDEEILEHPIFIHNFVMCILSILVMTIYLVQTWVLFDYWRWVRMEQDLQSSTTGDTESADYSDSVRRRDSRVMETFMADKKINERKTRQQTIKLAPIPALEELSTPAAIVHRNADIEAEPILYCCFIDWYRYIKTKVKSKPKHEFQVVHVM